MSRQLYGGRGAGRYAGRGRGNYGGGLRGARNPTTTSATAAEYRAPTAGLETVLFDCDGAKSASLFESTRKEIWLHVGTQSYTGANLASRAIETMTEPVFTVPAQPTAEQFTDARALAGEMDLWWERRKNIQKKEMAWEEVGPRNFTLLLQHCPPKVKSRLSSRPDWDTVNASRDMIGLLRLLREVARSQDETKSEVMTVVEKDAELYLAMQGKQELDDFVREFTANCDTIEAHGGCPGFHPQLYNKAREDAVAEYRATHEAEPDAEQQAALDENVRKKQCGEYLALLFLRQLSTSRYKIVKRKLAKDVLDGIDSGPKQ